MNKKGNLAITGTITAIAGVAMILIVMFLVFSQLKSLPTITAQIAVNETNASTAINKTINAFSLVPSWFTIIIVVALGFGIMAYFYFKKR